MSPKPRTAPKAKGVPRVPKKASGRASQLTQKQLSELRQMALAKMVKRGDTESE